MSNTNNNNTVPTTFISDARMPVRRAGIPFDTLVAAAIRVQAVWDQIGPLVTHELINGNPLLRRIAAFAGDFVQERGKLPEGMDWQVWHETLDPQQRDGCWEVLQRLMAASLPPTPEFLCEAVLEEVRDHAGQLILSRIGEVGGSVSYETLERYVAEIKTLCRPAVPRSEMWLTLTALAAQPELLADPVEVVPRLVWRGRHTVLAGLAKLGKSTIAAQAAAAVTRAAPFLDGNATYGRVVWVGLDEHLGDTVRRHQYFGARGNRIRILALPPRGGDALLGSLEQLLDEWPADLVVLDSLIEWARRVSKDMPKEGDSAGWSQVVRPLTALAHEHNVGLLTLAHSRRADGRYRSSGEIAAATDVLYDMLGPGGREKDSTLRHFEGVGRWEVGQWKARMVDGAYVFGGEAGAGVNNDDKLERVAQQILEVLGKAADRTIVGKNELCRQISGSPNICYKALTLIEERGQVTVSRRGNAQAITLVVKPQ